MRIGVFDSGVGGLSVARAVQAAFPEYTVDYANDTKNIPYGDKTPQEMVRVSLEVLRPLAERTDVIVIACNSLTTNGLTQLRKILPVPLVGVEPMIETAAARTKTGIIAVCATPATLKSQRYRQLKDMHAGGVRVLEPDCSHWAQMVESEVIEHQEIQDLIDDVCNQGADVIVLGCTHYHWIEQTILQAAKARAIVLQPEQTIISQLRTTLAAPARLA